MRLRSHRSESRVASAPVRQAQILVWLLGRLRLLAALVGFAGFLNISRAPAYAQSPHLPTLKTVGAVHTLSNGEAARAYPVDLKAVVTYFDPYNDLPRRPIIMVTDATASIYVGISSLSMPPIPPIKPGMLVHVRGVSNPGDFGPSILQARIGILGPSHLPAFAPRQSLTHLLTGSEDAQWVEVEGVVKSFEVSGMNVTLKLALADGEIAATTVKDPGADYAGLIDSKILLRGIAATLFNRQSQIFGVRLFFPGMESIRIEEAAPAHPFLLPVSRIRELMLYHPHLVFTHRVHLRGAVTLFWPGRMLCIQDGNAGADLNQNDADSLCAETAQTTAVEPGGMVDLLGFPQIGPVRATLSDTTFLPRAGSRPLSIAPIDGLQALSAVHDSQLVQMEGRIIAHDRASQDATIVVTSGSVTFTVALPRPLDPRRPEARSLFALREGSKVRFTGICSVQADTRVLTRHDGYPIVKFFQIMLRSPNDIVVLDTPSWWSAEHTLRVLAVALAVTMLVLIWSGYLRVRLKQQTQLLLYQATHDGLTGVWNRKAVLDLLRRESEQAARANQRVGVMMLDADHFKRVNDVYGHLAGDAVLRELACRIQKAVRSYDLTGRYGGEEFLVVLPNCGGEELRHCAERVRAAVSRDPIAAEGALLEVTVSVGTAVLDPLRNSQKDALAAADGALYEAKRQGRDRVVSSDLPPDPVVGPVLIEAVQAGTGR